MARPKGLEKKRLIVALPDILFGRVVAATQAEKLKRGFGYSMTRFVEEAVREKLDGPTLPTPRTQLDAPQVRKPAAQELATRFGITTAAQLDKPGAERFYETAYNAAVQVGNCPTEDVQPARDWLKFYRELEEMEPTEAQYAWSNVMADVKLPAGFRKLPVPKQVQWLQNNA